MMKIFTVLTWASMKTKYEKYLPYLKSRRDLRTIFTDLLGELNASHLRFTSNGPEEETTVKYSSACTGIMFDNNDPYVVDYILENSPADKEGLKVKKGDKLISVNGTSINPGMNRNYYFAGPFRDDEMTLEFVRDGQKFEVKIHPYNRNELQVSLYDEWVKERQNIVDERSKKKIAYIHMQSMTGSRSQPVSY